MLFYYICKVKIIYLHQYFRTPNQWGSTRSYYFAQAMREAGHEVHMICMGEGHKYQVKESEGIILHQLPVSYDQSDGYWSRVRSFMSYARQAYKISKKLCRNKAVPSLIYASSTPLTVGISALILKKTKGIPYYFEVRDLWPEAPVHLGIIKNKGLIKLLYILTRKIYKNAEKIISLSPGIIEGIKKYNIQTPIVLLSNFSDLNLFQPMEAHPGWKAKYLNDHEKGIIYFGALGYANHLAYFINLAEACQDLNLKFFIVGDGSEKETLAQLIFQKKLNNICMLPPLPKAELPELLSIMDFSYISFLHLPILETCSPNKFFDSLASGKITISNTSGWMAETINENQCGFYAPPEEISVFRDKIQVYLEDAQLLKQHQSNARKLAMEKYNAALICQELIKIIPAV